MAKRVSNQITFTEQKKILQIKEWYLAASFSTILTDEKAPMDTTEGQVWFNQSNDSNTRLMQLVNGEWIVCPVQFSEAVQRATAENKYLWNYEEVVYSIGESEQSSPVIIGTYGSVSDIVNYYAITSKPIAPDIYSNAWTTNFADVGENLSSVNKYLWNYEIVVYADGSTSDPQPAIIGVYGDSGKDAISFQIYPTVGLEFVDAVNEEERIDTIELRLSSFEGNQPLSGCVYTWYWWNSELNDYEGIVETSSEIFEVNINDKYALSNLKCEMTFDGNQGSPYVDYITLRKKIDVYSASINFFDGTNIFAPGKEYIVAYVNLYKNGKIEETVETSNYYTGIVALDETDSTVIKTEYKPEHYIYVDGVNKDTTGVYYVLSNGQYIAKSLPGDYVSTEKYYAYVDYDEEHIFLTYFVCSSNNGYEVILGGYDFQAEKWIVQNTETTVLTNYIYSTNNVSLEKTSNIFVVSKNDIARSKDVEIYIYQNVTDGEFDINESSFIASTKTTIIDLNDTIVSAEQPENPYEGQLWLDLTTNILKVYTNGAWKESIKQTKGKAIYTSKPSSYEKDDLWIVSAADAQGFGKNSSFTDGSMWRAKNNSGDAGFNSNDWIDANETLTKMKADIYQHFSFNPDTGLQIKQTDGKFYVNIKSDRMGFHYTGNIDDKEVDTRLQDNEVVYIGTNSARIRNLVVEGSADFNSEISVDSQISIVNIHGSEKTNAGFNFKIEPNGSFSLVRVEVE